jgi:hypothetical protein
MRENTTEFLAETNDIFSEKCPVSSKCPVSLKDVPFLQKMSRFSKKCPVFLKKVHAVNSEGVPRAKLE